MLFRDTPLANCEAYFVSIVMCILPVAVHYFISSILSTLRVAIALSKFFKVFFFHFSPLTIRRLGAIYFYMEIYFVWEGNYSLLKAKKKRCMGEKYALALHCLCRIAIQFDRMKVYFKQKSLLS